MHPLPRPATEETDELLMRRVQAGDRAAYDALYRRWQRPLYGFLLKRSASPQQTEDLLQRTWEQVYRYRASYDPARPFKPWLFTVAVRLAAGQRQGALVALDVLTEQLGAPARAEVKLRWRRTLAALHTLSETDRTLCLLASEQLSRREIGEALGMSEKTVRNRLSAARKKLKDALRHV